MQHRESLHLSRGFAHSLCSSDGNDPTKPRFARPPTARSAPRSLSAAQAVLHQGYSPRQLDTKPPAPDCCNRDPPAHAANALSKEPDAELPVRLSDPAYGPLGRPPAGAGSGYRPPLDACVPSPVYVHRNLGSPLFGGLHRLTIQPHHARMRVASRLLAHSDREGIDNSLPDSALAQVTEIVIDGFVRRQIMRQGFPATTVAGAIKNRVEQFPARMDDFRSARIWSLRQQRFDLLPLFVGQITGVGFSGYHLSSIARYSFLNRDTLSTRRETWLYTSR
jgi:hypothetical protein